MREDVRLKLLELKEKEDVLLKELNANRDIQRRCYSLDFQIKNDIFVGDEIEWYNGSGGWKRGIVTSIDFLGHVKPTYYNVTPLKEDGSIAKLELRLNNTHSVRIIKPSKERKNLDI